MLACFGCAGPIQSALEDAPQHAWPEGLVLTYVESGGSLGTREVRVDGALVVERRVRPGLDATAIPDATPREVDEDAPPVAPVGDDAIERRDQVSAAETQRLVETLVAIEAWEHVDADPLAQPPLDAQVARLTLERNGERTEIWEWAHELELTDRLVRIRRLLDAMLP